MGPSLYDAIIKDNKIVTMRQVQTIVRDVVKCLLFLKKSRLIHCDLKPENILFKTDINKGVKVIDFGSATFMDDVDYDYLQTRPYRAPEVTLGCQFDFAIDMWSLGCILYELVANKVLFNYQTVQENMAKALAINKQYSFDLFSDATKKKKFMLNNNLLFISSGAVRGSVEDLEVIIPRSEFDIATELKKHYCDVQLIDFIQKCLALDPVMRLSAEDALEHEFVKKAFN